MPEEGIIVQVVRLGGSCSDFMALQHPVDHMNQGMVPMLGRGLFREQVDVQMGGTEVPAHGCNGILPWSLWHFGGEGLKQHLSWLTLPVDLLGQSLLFTAVFLTAARPRHQIKIPCTEPVKNIN